MDDYVVAYNTETGKVVKVWKGEDFRPYRDPVHQLRISMADSPEDAANRALTIWRQLKKTDK